MLWVDLSQRSAYGLHRSATQQCLCVHAAARLPADKCLPHAVDPLRPCAQGIYTVSAYNAIRDTERAVNKDIFDDPNAGPDTRVFFIYTTDYIYWCAGCLALGAGTAILHVLLPFHMMHRTDTQPAHPASL